MEQDEKVRENRLREVARRRGYQLRKSRRRDPLAVDFGRYYVAPGDLDFGEWFLSRGEINGVPFGNVSGFETLDDVESFLDGNFGPVEPGEG
jgi:hypothetical protein